MGLWKCVFLERFLQNQFFYINSISQTHDISLTRRLSLCVLSDISEDTVPHPPKCIHVHTHPPLHTHTQSCTHINIHRYIHSP